MRATISTVVLGLLLSSHLTSATLMDIFATQESKEESLSITLTAPPSNTMTGSNSTVSYVTGFTTAYNLQIPTGLITIGSNGVTLNVTIDPESPATLFNWDEKNNNMTNKNSYNPLLSSTATSNDYVRARDGSLNSVGTWLDDQVCVNYQPDVSKANTTKLCWYQDFLAVQLYADAYAPLQGTIGLGVGTPRYGNHFLSNLKTASGGKIATNWTYLTGPYYNNLTRVMIGGPAWGYLQPGNAN